MSLMCSAAVVATEACSHFMLDLIERETKHTGRRFSKRCAALPHGTQGVGLPLMVKTTVEEATTQTAHIRSDHNL